MYSQSIPSFKLDALAFGPAEPSATGCLIHVHFIVKPWWIASMQIFIWKQHLMDETYRRRRKTQACLLVAQGLFVGVCVSGFVCSYIGLCFGYCSQKDMQVSPSACSPLPPLIMAPWVQADSSSCLSCLIYESRANKCIPAGVSSPVWEAKVVVPIFWIHIVWIDACPQSSTFTPHPNPCPPASRPGNRCNYGWRTKTLFRFNKHGVYVLEL